MDTLLREAVKVELQAMGLADVPEDLIDEEVARIKQEAGTDGNYDYNAPPHHSISLMLRSVCPALQCV